jgi:hypothetical protein
MLYILIAILGVVADMAISGYGISRYGGRIESNKFVLRLYQRYGYAGLLVPPFVVFFIALGVYFYLRGGVAVFAALMWVPFIWNIIIIGIIHAKSR